jgi:uncharacterized protein with von Willebrand factor type A (vWA) domain
MLPRDYFAQFEVGRYDRCVVSPVPTADVLARLPAEEQRWITELRPALQRRFGARLSDLRLFGYKVRGDDTTSPTSTCWSS